MWHNYGNLALCFLVASVLVLGGCAGSTNSVDNAGVTTIDFGYDAEGNPELHAVTGKEYDNIEAAIDVTEGKGYIKASKVRGFEGQLAAAEVEKRFAEFYEKASPELKSVLDNLLGVVKDVLK